MSQIISCREGCGACCIAASISSAIPGMPYGKAANIACIHLDQQMRCAIFEQSERPKVCSGLKACSDMCGNNRDEALHYLAQLEVETAPNL